MSELNKPWIEIHLREALEQLEQTLRALGNADYSDVEYEIDLAHAYNHINTAWNSRFASDEIVATQQGPLFYQWRGFPDDIDMGPPNSTRA